MNVRIIDKNGVEVQEVLVSDALAIHVQQYVANTYGMPSAQWRLLYSTRLDGKSFQQMVQHIVAVPGTLIVIKVAGAPLLIGGYCESPWQTVAARHKQAMRDAAAIRRAARENQTALTSDKKQQSNDKDEHAVHKVFFGNNHCFVFHASSDGKESSEADRNATPAAGIFYPAREANANYMYLFDTHPQVEKEGIGMGGQIQYFGWFVDRFLEHGNCRGTRCSTFVNPRLTDTEEWLVEAIEVYAIDARLCPSTGSCVLGNIATRKEADLERDKALLELSNIHKFGMCSRSREGGVVVRALEALVAVCDEDKHAHLLQSCRHAEKCWKALDGEDDVERIVSAVMYPVVVIGNMTSGDSKCILTSAALRVLDALVAQSVIDGSMLFRQPALPSFPARHGLFRAADITASAILQANSDATSRNEAATSLVAKMLDALSRLVARLGRAIDVSGATVSSAHVEPVVMAALRVSTSLVVSDELGLHGEVLVQCVALACTCTLLASHQTGGKNKQGEAFALCSRTLITLLRRAHVLAATRRARASDGIGQDGGHLLDDIWREVCDDCIAVIRFLCRGSARKDDEGVPSERDSILLRMSLLRLILARMLPELRSDEAMQRVILHDVMSLVRRCLVHAFDVPLSYLNACLHILLALVQHHATISDSLSLLVLDVLLPLLDVTRVITHGSRVAGDVQLAVLRFLAQCLSSPTLLFRLYMQCDCSALRVNVVKLIVVRLARLTSQMRGRHTPAVERTLEPLRRAAYEALRSFLRSLGDTARMSSNAEHNVTHHASSPSRESLASRGALMDDGTVCVTKPSLGLADVLAVEASDMDSAADEASVRAEREDETHTVSETEPNSEVIMLANDESESALRVESANRGDDVSRLVQVKEQKERMMRLFNEEMDFAGAMRVAEESGLVHTDDAVSVAHLLRSGSGLILDPAAVGAYLSRHHAFQRAVLKAYVQLHDVHGMALDEAVRHFLGTFRLCGEAEAVDATMELFAAHYHESNPGIFRSAGAAFVLAFSIVMLNTDAHSTQVKAKMTLDEFVRNNRGMNDGSDFDDALLSAIYARITANEIVVVGSSDVGRYTTTLCRHLAASPRVDTDASDSASTHDVGGNDYRVEGGARHDKTPVTDTQSCSPIAESVAHEVTIIQSSACTSQPTHGSNPKVGSCCEASRTATADECQQTAVVSLIVRDMWYILLPTLSFPLEETEDEAVVDPCLECFSHIIHLCARCGLHTVLTTFISALFTFTHLTNPHAITMKNIKATNLLLSAAARHGYAFGDCWRNVVRCISLIDKLTSQAPEQSVAVSSSHAEHSSIPRRTSNNASSSATGATAGGASESTPRATPVMTDKAMKIAAAVLRSPSQGNTESGTTASRSNDLIARHVSLLNAERLFAQSPQQLPVTALFDLLRALCAVSREELRESPARVYCVQHMVEVVQLNRTRLLQARHWAVAWPVVSSHVVDCIASHDVTVALFAINSVRHLSLILLSDEACGAAGNVASAALQHDLLSLYATIAERDRPTAVLELLVASLGQLVASHGSHLCMAAWLLMLDALVRCAQCEPAVGPAVLTVLDTVTSDHLPSLRALRAAGNMCRLVQAYAAVAQGAAEYSGVAATQALSVLLVRLVPVARTDVDDDTSATLPAWQMCFATLAALAVMTDRGLVAKAAIGVLVSDALGLVAAWSPCTTLLFTRCFINVLDVLVVRCAVRPRVVTPKPASAHASVSSTLMPQHPDTVTLFDLLHAYVEGLTTGAPQAFLAAPITMGVEEGDAGPCCISTLFHTLLRHLTCTESDQVQEVCAEGVHRLLCVVADARIRPSTSSDKKMADDGVAMNYSGRGGLWGSFCRGVLTALQGQMGMLRQLCSRPCLALVTRQMRANRVSLTSTIALARLTRCMFYESCDAITTLTMQCLQDVFDSAAALVASSTLTRATSVTADATMVPYRWIVALLTSLQLAVSEVFVDVYVQLCVDAEQHPQITSTTVVVQHACDTFMSHTLQIYTHAKDDAMLAPPASLAGQQNLRVAQTVMHAQLSSLVQVSASELHRRMHLFMSELCTLIRYADDKLAPLLSDLFMRFWSTEIAS